MTHLPSDAHDAAFAARVTRLFDPWARRYFRYRLRGAARVPPAPCLLVGNHSALGTVELLCMLWGWRRELGARRVRGLMHDVFVRAPITGPFWRALGAVPASRENALAALAAGQDVVVFPGGDLDACRPFYEPRAVHFGSRRGYVRLALEAGVPVVPLATIGSHYTWLMAPGGLWLARALGLKRWLRNERVPLPLGILAAAGALIAILTGVLPAWLGLLIALGGLLPSPARITTEVLAPIDLAAATAHLRDANARIELGHALVHGALAAAVARMEHDRPLADDQGHEPEDERSQQQPADHQGRAAAISLARRGLAR